MKALARIAFAGSAAAMLAAPVAAVAQDEDYTPPRATGYEEVLELPDWTGIWYPDWSLLFSGREAVRPKFTPLGQRLVDEYNASVSENGPSQEAQAKCLPPGFPGMMQQPYPIEILFSPGRVTLITEAYTQVQRIYTDGRELPDPEVADLFFAGNSVGYWDGDTLVVDVVGLHPETNLVAGVKHTEASRVHEHIYLQAPGELIVEMTFYNEELLEEPMTTKIAYRLDNEFPMREWICAENNRLVSGEDGANIDLGFDHLDEPDPFGPSD